MSEVTVNTVIFGAVVTSFLLGLGLGYWMGTHVVPRALFEALKDRVSALERKK